jgi:serine/threonine protein kinase
MHGGELFNRLADDGGFAEKKARELFFNLTGAVAYCHRKGIVHRDLKPENILLKTANKGDEHDIKLADFGIAAHLPKRLIGKSPEVQEKAMPFYRLCGSPEYMAPEVIRANKTLKRGYGPKCDIWSLGVFLYVLLAGEPPFTMAGGEDVVEEEEDEDDLEKNDRDGGGDRNLPAQVRRLFRAICTGKFSMEDKCWSRISSSAKNLISKMLSVDVSLRPSARQVLCDKWFKGMIMPAHSGEIASPSLYPSLSSNTTEEGRMAFLKRREFLLDIGSRFSRATKLKALLKDGVQRCCQLMHADRGTIFVVDHENQKMWTEVAEGLRGVAIEIPLGAGLVGTCYKSGTVINVEDAIK